MDAYKCIYVLNTECKVERNLLEDLKMHFSRKKSYTCAINEILPFW